MPAATASIRGKSAGGPGRGIRGAGQIANQRSASKCEGGASRAGRSPHTRGPCEQFSSTSSASRPVLANSLSDCTHSALVGFLRVNRLQARSERPGNLAFHDAMFSQLKRSSLPRLASPPIGCGLPNAAEGRIFLVLCSEAQDQTSSLIRPSRSQVTSLGLPRPFLISSCSGRICRLIAGAYFPCTLISRRGCYCYHFIRGLRRIANRNSHFFSHWFVLESATRLLAVPFLIAFQSKFVTGFIASFRCV